MFGFSSNNETECPVTEETRQWIEECFTSLIKLFDEENIRQKKVLLPEPADFPVEYDGSFKSVAATAGIVARQMEIDPGLIRLDVYKEGQREIEGVLGQRMFLGQVEKERYSAGLYFGKREDGKYHIALEEGSLQNPVKMIATLAHEMAHIKLLGEQRIDKNNEDLTDLATIVFGLGIFNANASFELKNSFDSWTWSRSGYLSPMQWGYSLALFAYIRKEEEPKWIGFLDKDIQKDVLKSLRFIRENPEKLFKPSDKKEEAVDPRQEITKGIMDGWKVNDFAAVSEGYKRLIELDPGNQDCFNGLGYALIQQKKYAEAIDYFDQALALDPAMDFAFNNRGYCRLQLGQLNQALADIQKACDMNPFNSFAWRNLGAYCLAKGEAATALEHFESALELDAETEMINFYLAKAYIALGDAEKASEHAKTSIETGELNDSLLNDLEI